MGSLDKESQFTARRQQTNNQHDLTFGKVLLQLARNTIWRHLDDKENLSHQLTNHPAPGDRSGVFVTLWGQSSTKQPGVASDYDELRGCIGRLQSNMPLNEAVQEAAIGAATRDPRFVPITLRELKDVRIEIAILSPLAFVHDLQQLVIGKHGLMIEGGGRRGLLLPKVAVRMNWDQRSFLEGVCMKAGLVPSEWPSNSTLYSFTTVVFDERDYD